MPHKHPRNLFCCLLTLSLMPITSSAGDMNDYEFIAPQTAPCSRSSRAHSHPRIDADEYLRIDADFRSPTATESYSTNWAGYVAAVGDMKNPMTHAVTKVVGSWVVPNLQGSAAPKTWCSMWIGIDGIAPSKNVTQCGTEHDVENGMQSHYAWYEMFPAPSVSLTNFAVNVGDRITATITYVALPGILPQGNTLYIMQMTNETTKMYTLIPSIATTDLPRLCAEWIVEAPFLNETLPLSNFGTAYMSNCSATINNITGGINNAAWNNQRMTMISTNGGTVKANTSPVSADGKSFSVTWKGN